MPGKLAAKSASNELNTTMFHPHRRVSNTFALKMGFKEKRAFVGGKFSEVILEGGRGTEDVTHLQSSSLVYVKPWLGAPAQAKPGVVT